MNNLYISVLNGSNLIKQFREIIYILSTAVVQGQIPISSSRQKLYLHNISEKQILY
jgi:hypothetical protein